MRVEYLNPDDRYRGRETGRARAQGGVSERWSENRRWTLGRSQPLPVAPAPGRAAHSFGGGSRDLHLPRIRWPFRRPPPPVVLLRRIQAYCVTGKRRGSSATDGVQHMGSGAARPGYTKQRPNLILALAVQLEKETFKQMLVMESLPLL